MCTSKEASRILKQLIKISLCTLICIFELCRHEILKQEVWAQVEFLNEGYIL